MQSPTDLHLTRARQRAISQIKRTVTFDEAEDAIQDALLRYWSRGRSDCAAKSLATEDDLVYWLVAVARNCLCDKFRRAATRPCIALCENDAPVLPRDQDLCESVPFQVVVQQAWEQLSDTHRAALALRAEGDSCVEAASVLGVSVDTYKTRVHRAKERFAELLIKNGLDDPRERKSDLTLRNCHINSTGTEDHAGVGHSYPIDDLD